MNPSCNEQVLTQFLLEFRLLDRELQMLVCGRVGDWLKTNQSKVPSDAEFMRALERYLMAVAGFAEASNSEQAEDVRVPLARVC